MREVGTFDRCLRANKRNLNLKHEITSATLRLIFKTHYCENDLDLFELVGVFLVDHKLAAGVQVGAIGSA